MASFLLSIPKQQALVILPSVLSPLSLLGSAGVIYLIARRKDKSSNRSYNRLMLMTCVIDLICSSWWMLGSLPVPKETRFYGARGNTRSCEIAGFFLQLRFIQFTYNIGVVLYFLLTIRFGMKQERFAKQIEPLVHVVSILLPLISAILGLFLKVFNPVGYGNVCYIGSYPPACQVVPGVECTRGQSASIVVWFFMLAPGLIYSVFYYVAIFLIYNTVRKQEMRTIRSSLNSDTVKARIRNVAIQSILYAVFFFNSFFWVCVTVLLTAIANDPVKILDNHAVYGIQILAQIFFSLQGLFTFAIYIRPRYMNLRKAKPHKSRLWVVCKTVLITSSEIENVRGSQRDSRRPDRSVSRKGSSDGLELERGEERHPVAASIKWNDQVMEVPPDEPVDPEGSTSLELHA